MNLVPVGRRESGRPAALDPGPRGGPDREITHAVPSRPIKED